MTNQSLIQVPLDLKGPDAVRNFLLRLVENLDIILGNRSGESSLYVSQKQLEETGASISNTIEEGVATLEDLIDEAARVTKASINEVDVQQTGAIDEINSKLNSRIALGTVGGTFTPITLLSNQVLDGTVKATWVTASDANVSLTGDTATFSKTGTYLVSVAVHNTETTGAKPKIQLAYDGGVVGPISVGEPTESTEVISSYVLLAASTKTVEVWIGNASATAGTSYTQLPTSSITIYRIV